MAVLIYCSTCNRYISLQHARCPHCGEALKRHGQYRVNLPSPCGKRATKVVHGVLEDALRVEQEIRQSRDSMRNAVTLSGLHRSGLSVDFFEHLLAFLLSPDSPVCFILFDSSWQITEVSGGACLLLGQVREDLTPKSVRTLFPAIPVILENGQLPELSGASLKTLVTVRGSRGDMEVECFLLRVNSKDPAQFALLLLDNRAHAKHDFTSAMEEIFNHAPVGIYQITPQGRVQYANPRMAQMFGYTSPEAFMESVHDVEHQLYLHSEDRGLVLARLDAGSVASDIEFELVRRDSTPFWARFTSRVVRDDNGKVMYYEGFISDISARKRAEQELKKSWTLQEKYRRELEAVFGAISDGVVSMDQQMRLVAVNPGFERICPESELVRSGVTLQDLPRDCVAAGCFLSAIKFFSMPNSNSAPRLTAPRRDVDCPRSLDKNLSLEVVTAALMDEHENRCGAVLTLRDVSKLIALEQKLTAPKSYKRIVGTSPDLQKVYHMIDRLRETDSAVLILGESGTGKELLAEALHYTSVREKKPFVKINCAALSESLLESDLFGHIKGAFTGADANKVGRLQMAEGGTALLDEIGDISHNIQLKLLRFLDYKEYQRVGDPKTHSANVRIIASTNADLAKKIEQGTFRADLYYRLKIISIHMPPLRTIKQDIPMLAQHFLGMLNRELGKNLNLAKAALDRLMEYDWPGNVRELKHVLEYACVVCTEETIATRHLPSDIMG